MAIQTIQYQNKVALNTNPEIADINKVTDNDMNEIKSVVNNNANETSNNTTSITNLNTYSTNEKQIGTWIDNKPIYRKVFNTTWSRIDVSSLNISTMIDMRGVVAYANGVHSLNAYANANFYSLVQYSSVDHEIIPYGKGYDNQAMILIIEYTKTTD